jgi:hypothetical protein
VTSTLITLLAGAAMTVAVVWLLDRARRRAARRDREIVRRIQTYLSSLPPARPW